MLLVASLLATRAAPLQAQGFLQKLGAAARTSADVAAELALARATPIDVSRWQLRTLAVGPGVSFGIERIDVLDSVGVRVRAYLENATSEPVTVSLPDSRQFVLSDRDGRALPSMSRVRVGGKAEVREVTVPAGKRTLVIALFRRTASQGTRASLTVGTLGTIDDLPIHSTVAGSSPASIARGDTPRQPLEEGVQGRSPTPEPRPDVRADALPSYHGVGARVRLGDVEIAPPAGWTRRDLPGSITGFIHTGYTDSTYSFVSVFPPERVSDALEDVVRREMAKRREQPLGDWTSYEGAGYRERGLWTTERRADGREVFRRYRVLQVESRATMLLGVASSFARDKQMLDIIYDVSATLALDGRGPGAGASGRAVSGPSAAPAPRGATGRKKHGDVGFTPPAGWTLRERPDGVDFVDPTSRSERDAAYVTVYPSEALPRGTQMSGLDDWLRARWKGGARESEAKKPWGSTQENGQDVSHTTRERRSDGTEVLRHYEAVHVGDRVAMVVATTTSTARDEGLRDAHWEMTKSTTVGGRGLTDRWVRPSADESAEELPMPSGPAPRPRPTPAPQPRPAPAPKAAPAPATGRPNFVGTYFSWGTISAKLLILADGSWESGPSKGHWTYGGGRMVVLDGNARGWCGGRGILNDDETQLSFDCVMDGHPVNVSFAKYSREIMR